MNELELADDPRFRSFNRRQANRVQLDQHLAQWTRRLSSHEVEM